VAKIAADSDSGFEQALGTTIQVRQASARGDVGRPSASPRTTQTVATLQTLIGQQLQNNSPAEFFGGPMLATGPGNNTAGGNLLSGAAADGGHSQQDTQTPATLRQPTISGGVPGAQNVRNQIAERYKQAPGQMHTYQSAARPDQAPVNRGGQATDGNVHPGAASESVVVPNRYCFDGVTTWSALREMPYGGRGNGARGADLNGQRYYAAGQSDQFFNAGMGDYGIGRIQGSGVGRPVGFAEPAPWTANFYDTTTDVGTADNPGTNAQSPAMVYISPSSGRASNGTGRAS
jgi:hypothetical protein